jgi:integrase
MLGARFIKPPKNVRARVVPLDVLAVDALRRHRAEQNAIKMRNRDRYDEQGLVFANGLGGLLDLDAVSKAFAVIAKSVGIKAKGISLHSLRHFVTSVGVNKHDVRTVAGLLGHGDASTTLRMYANLIEGEPAKAVTSVGDAIREAQALQAAAQK